jgi:hypothetical protein
MSMMTLVAELEFKDPDDQIHYVFVAPEFIRAAH